MPVSCGESWFLIGHINCKTKHRNQYNHCTRASILKSGWFNLKLLSVLMIFAIRSRYFYQSITGRSLLPLSVFVWPRVSNIKFKLHQPDSGGKKKNGGCRRSKEQVGRARSVKLFSYENLVLNCTHARTTGTFRNGMFLKFVSRLRKENIN